MKPDSNEQELLHSAALQTSQSIMHLRQRAEQQLLEAKQTLEARTIQLAHSLSVMRGTLDATTDGILVVNEEGRVADFNEQFLGVFGMKRELVAAGDRQPLLHLAVQQLKNPEEFLAHTKEVYATAPAESHDRLEFLDGRVIERYSKQQRIGDRVVGRVWSYRDVTERVRAEAEREKLLVSEKEARERAERETRMKDEFLATISHELRTPLNAILGWANILRTSANPEDVSEGIEVIERNARAQAQIIEDLLDMSRIISGKVRLDNHPLDLVPLIKTAIESANPMATAKRLTINAELDPAAGHISGDPARIQQVLWNLLTNAVKFTPKDGRVNVILDCVDSQVRIRVIDSGQGITSEFLPHVFDRFRQADATTTRRHGGLGLGLAIVKNLVDLHGGSVGAESAGEKQGSTFTVMLPLVAAKFATTPERQRARGEAPGQSFSSNCDLTGLRILVVDDELDARQLIKRILTECGAAVEMASSGMEALELLQRNKPHVFITDIGMPDEDGYAIMRKVRRLSAAEGGAVPAIALTAFARAEDRERAIESGFQMHMAKPVEATELITAVANLTGRETGATDVNASERE